ncbi:MAG: aminotransferase class III-fold pyridoxal phosphate-dependent enzyme, partial [Roseicyclus sp.]
EAVTAAVIRAIEGGVCPTLACREQIELAERLAEIVPNAEASFFLKSGSDATSLAVRLARAVTGRSTVLRWGYHGWHDWCAPSAQGTVVEHRRKTRSFDYNSLESLSQAFASSEDDVACVIMMPFEIELPAPGYLEGVRELCSKNGALLIFDEVRSGFRVALGGAQQAYGVDADLVCLSKAIANGHPLSVLSGRYDHMCKISEVSASSTFFRGRDGFAAGLATLDELAKAFGANEPPRLSASICAAFDSALMRSGAPLKRVGHQAAPFLSWPDASSDREAKALRQFCATMLSEGVLLHPAHHWFFNLALSNADILHLETAATRVLDNMVSDGAFDA